MQGGNKRVELPLRKHVKIKHGGLEMNQQFAIDRQMSDVIYIFETCGPDMI